MIRKCHFSSARGSLGVDGVGWYRHLIACLVWFTTSILWRDLSMVCIIASPSHLIPVLWFGAARVYLAFRLEHRGQQWFGLKSSWTQLQHGKNIPWLGSRGSQGEASCSHPMPLSCLTYGHSAPKVIDALQDPYIRPQKNSSDARGSRWSSKPWSWYKSWRWLDPVVLWWSWWSGLVRSSSWQMVYHRLSHYL